MKRSIVWFRNDLRLHDNEALKDAISNSDEVIPVFVLDPRVFRGKTRYGFPKTGKFRLKFILESLADLRQNLESLGSTLYVFEGLPEDVIPRLAWDLKTHYIYCNRERTDEEVKVQDALEKKLWSIGQEIRYYRGKMLYYTADLPFPITHCPDQFTSFRKEVERFVKIREPLKAPDQKLNPVSVNLEVGGLPTLNDFGIDDFEVTKGISLKGGETAALSLLQDYIWNDQLIESYKQTRNELLGMEYSSKLSAYLAAGCISPKQIYQQIKEYQDESGEKESSYHLIFELYWRDFFRFMGKKHGNSIFQLEGFSGSPDVPANEDRELFESWASGATGIPFIDANMIELNSTGYMSNRGRQNVASFLVKDLKLNWIMGADYFESLLIDYDPCSNYGNWNYIAGVGSDPRNDRYFNIAAQARKYDPKAEFILYWLPQLEHIDHDYLFNPFGFDSSGDILEGINYQKPCIPHISW